MFVCTLVITCVHSHRNLLFKHIWKPTAAFYLRLLTIHRGSWEMLSMERAWKGMQIESNEATVQRLAILSLASM